ncbi:hypothetical protein GGG16DRAFT_119965 [Schizophyllum commune]
MTTTSALSSGAPFVADAARTHSPRSRAPQMGREHATATLERDAARSRAAARGTGRVGSGRADRSGRLGICRRRALE